MYAAKMLKHARVGSMDMYVCLLITHFCLQHVILNISSLLRMFGAVFALF